MSSDVSGEQTRREEITILVHGTFANPGYDEPDGGGTYITKGDGDEPKERKWWRVTSPGATETTADRLEQALRDIDSPLAETVWRPGEDPRDLDMSYWELVEWSGLNRHKDRVQRATISAISSSSTSSLSIAPLLCISARAACAASSSSRSPGSLP